MGGRGSGCGRLETAVKAGYWLGFPTHRLRWRGGPRTEFCRLWGHVRDPAVDAGEGVPGSEKSQGSGSQDPHT